MASDYPPPFLEPVEGVPPGILYGSFWARLAAYIMDRLILFVAYVALTTVAVGGYALTTGVSVAVASQRIGVIVALIAAAVEGAYFYFLWRRGQTVGMMATGIEIVGEADGARLTPEEAGIRTAIFLAPTLTIYLVPVLGTFLGLLLLISFLSVAWDPHNQGWHDKVAHTIVVKRYT